MPVVTVQMWTGAHQGAEARAGAAPSPTPWCSTPTAKPTNLHVIIQEVPREDWALAGVMGDERKD